MAERSNDPEQPSQPGWYPDPWSATGEGERYFDGKSWGSADRPLGRMTTVESERAPAKLHRGQRDPGDSYRTDTDGHRSSKLRRYGPVAVFVALVLLAWGIPKLLADGGSNRSGTKESGAKATTAPAAASSAERPPPSTEEAARPRGVPGPIPSGSGSYEILQAQRADPAIPVAWDPCRPVHYVVNPAGAPADGDKLLKQAISRVTTATGLEFVNDGQVAEQAVADRAPYLPERYPKRWAPVLVSWSTERTFPALTGSVAGTAAPHAVGDDNNRLVYVSGQIVLDAKDLSASGSPDRADARAAMLHELGHLVGLDHTADRTQVMYSDVPHRIDDYGAGDLRGLALLGTQPCAPSL